MKIIFIVGASRSGTTMLNQVLGNHPSIVGLNELHYFGDLWSVDDAGTTLEPAALERVAAELLRRIKRGIWGEPAGRDEREQARGIVARMATAERTGARLFEAVLEATLGAGVELASEQTPRNVFYADRLLALYPEARVVHIVRDPRAVLASQKNRWRRRWLGGSSIPWRQVLRVRANYHPVTMAQLWKRAVVCGLSLRAHPRAITLRFEDLVSMPEETVAKLCDFLEIDFQGQMLEVPQSGSSNRSDRADAFGITSAVVDRWREVLSPGEIAITEHLTRKLMQTLGYEPVRPRKATLSVAAQGLSFPAHLLGVALSNPRRAWIQFNAWSRSAGR